jgi:hypothetical protein
MHTCAYDVMIFTHTHTHTQVVWNLSVDVLKIFTDLDTKLVDQV